MGNVGVDFFHIDYAIAKYNVLILLSQLGQGWMVLFLEIGWTQISLAHQKRQNVTQTEEIVTVDVLSVAVIIVKINPAVIATIFIYKDVIASYVSVLFTLFMEKLNGFNAFNETI